MEVRRGRGVVIGLVYDVSFGFIINFRIKFYRNIMRIIWWNNFYIVVYLGVLVFVIEIEELYKDMLRVGIFKFKWFEWWLVGCGF